MNTGIAAPVDDRLERIESSLGELAGSIRSLSELVASKAQPKSTLSFQHCESVFPRDQLQDANEVSGLEDPAQALSSLSHISSDLESLKSQLPSVPSRLNGLDSLNDLSKELTDTTYAGDMIREDVRLSKRSSHMFYIPIREQGEALIRSKSLNSLCSIVELVH